jgi:hypothetical protein
MQSRLGFRKHKGKAALYTFLFPASLSRTNAVQAQSRGPTRPNRSAAGPQEDADTMELLGSAAPRTGRQIQRRRELNSSEPEGPRRRGVELVAGVERSRRGSAGSGVPRVPLSEVEHMLAAAKAGAPSSLMNRIWGCTRCD